MNKKASLAAAAFVLGCGVAPGAGTAEAQFVWGRGTPGTIPVWTGQGFRLGNSHVTDDGTKVSVGLPLQAAGAGTTPGLFGIGNDGVGVDGWSSKNHGVIGRTDAETLSAGVAGFGVEYGVLGFASNPDVGWGVKGIANGTAVGVEGFSPYGAGIRGQALACDADGCTATAGTGGQFLAGEGGLLVHGFLVNAGGEWIEKLRLGADGSGAFAGDLSVSGSAFKPGGGSWSTLSDRRTKKDVEPLQGALQQLLQLHGVAFEYADPSAVHERSGRHIGMVAQDVEQVFPSWVDAGKDGYLRVTFRGFEALAVEAVRELDAQLAAGSRETSSRIEALERENAELRRTLEGIASRLDAERRE